MKNRYKAPHHGEEEIRWEGKFGCEEMYPKSGNIEGLGYMKTTENSVVCEDEIKIENSKPVSV